MGTREFRGIMDGFCIEHLERGGVTTIFQYVNGPRGCRGIKEPRAVPGIKGANRS